MQGRLLHSFMVKSVCPSCISCSFHSPLFHLFLCSQAFFSVWLHIIQIFLLLYIPDPFFHLCLIVLSEFLPLFSSAHKQKSEKSLRMVEEKEELTICNLSDLPKWRGFKGGHMRGTSLVGQWLRLPEQEARLQSLVRELDPIGAATKTQHNQIKKKEMDTWGCLVLQGDWN